MFEDSVVESGGRLRSKSQRWITVGSFGLQCLVAAVIVVVPMVRPEALSIAAISPVVVMPVLKKASVVVKKHPEMTSRADSVMALPTVMAATRAAVLPSMRVIEVDTSAGLTVPSNFKDMRAPGGGDPFGAVGTGQPVVVVATPKKMTPVPVSSGVVAGLLIGEIRPVYPPIAVLARIEGVVVVEATISRGGIIESARVITGPAMLANAALDAVRMARYRPYRLNGEATEVQTTVTVNFRLGGAS